MKLYEKTRKMQSVVAMLVAATLILSAIPFTAFAATTGTGKAPMVSSDVADNYIIYVKWNTDDKVDRLTDNGNIKTASVSLRIPGSATDVVVNSIDGWDRYEIGTVSDDVAYVKLYFSPSTLKTLNAKAYCTLTVRNMPYGAIISRGDIGDARDFGGTISCYMNSDYSTGYIDSYQIGRNTDYKDTVYKTSDYQVLSSAVIDGDGSYVLPMTSSITEVISATGETDMGLDAGVERCYFDYDASYRARPYRGYITSLSVTDTSGNDIDGVTPIINNNVASISISPDIYDSLADDISSLTVLVSANMQMIDKYGTTLGQVVSDDTTLTFSRPVQTVSFNTWGGSSVAQQSVYYHAKATEPASDPVKENYDFKGWYADAACTVPFDFSATDIVSDTTVYAKWLEHTHNYSYEVNAEDAGQLIESCTCGHQETVTLKMDADTYKYTGSSITPVKVVYSDGWVGEKNAEVQYVDNTNVGTAKATLTIEGKTIEKTFVIVKGDAPVITFPEAVNSITYGQPLKDAGLTFTSNEYGSFNWVAPNGIAKAGVGGYAVDFVPSSEVLDNYDWASLDGQDGLRWIENRQTLCSIVNVTVNKADISHTAPTANDLTYSRENQDLVTTGTVNGGVMWYALGTDDVTAPTTEWSETVPQGTNAGTYYVWYKVVGDSNHNDVDPACVSVTIARKDISSAVVIAADMYYTGFPHVELCDVYVNGVIIGDDNYLVEHFDNIDVGTATVVVTGVGNYTGTVTGHYEIQYRDYAASATVHGTLGENGWYIGEVTLKAPQNFKIATSQDGEWRDTISVDVEHDGEITYYLKNELYSHWGIGQKTLSLEIDLNNPNTEISIGENRWNSFLNAITFGLFFKETKRVSIVASDTMSGIARIEYIISDTEITEFDSVAWNLYSDSFNIQPNSKNVIYAKVTDDSGRYTIVNTDGIVLYTDSVALTDSIVTTFKAGVDKSSTIKLNGNLIKEVKNGSNVLDSADYEVSLNGDELTLTLKSTYLDTLNAGSYIFTVSYNPLGEIYDYGMDGDEPTDTHLNVIVQKAESSVTNISSLDKTYDGSAVSSPTYNVVGDGTVTVEYKAKDAEDNAYTTVAPKDAGKYVVRVNVAATENYNATSETANFEIAKKSVTVTATAPDKVYDGTNDVDESAIVLEFSGLISGDSVGFSVKECWYNGASVGVDKIVPIVFNVTGDDAKNYTFPTGSEVVAPDYYVEALADITQKELTIVWGETKFTYDGKEKFPEYTVQGIVDGDVVEFTCVGAATDARHEYIGVITGISGDDSANYQLVGTPTKEFVINKADQTAPTVNKVDETISGKNDGKIIDVTTDMEYRADGEETYTTVTGESVENLADGKYYVRVKGDNNHNPSPETEISITKGKMLVVTYKADGEVVDTVEVEYGKDAKAPAIPEKKGYTQTAPTWNVDGKNIIEDTEINAVYTKDADSPKTGDYNHPWLWVVTIWGSAVVLFVLVLDGFNRKKVK